MADPSTSSSLAALKSLPEILGALSALDSQDAELSASLQQLLAAQEPIADALARLRSLAPHLDGLRLEASLLTEKVSATADTAQRVGGRVRQLDEQMHRVRDAGERVGQVMELKNSLAALRMSVESRDWEAACRHCARAMQLPTHVICGPFAEKAVPSSEDPRPPAQALQAAREELLAVFQREFQHASTSRDAVATSRFFKLFPSIGWEAEGLEAYAAFVVDLVRVRPPTSAKPSSPLYYTTALTALFESIALIVDQHQPVVEKYYGQGKMISVIHRLLQESDRVTKGLLDGWEEQRSMKRKLSDTSSSVFAITASGINKASPPAPAEEDVADPREIDQVLTEVASMAGRWSLIRKFLFDRLQEDDDETEAGSTVDGNTEADNSTSHNQISDGPPPIPPDFEAVESSACRQAFEDLLNTYYIPLELWYIRTIIYKAHQLSKPDLSALPATTTTPDDAFYILKIVLQRLLSTGMLPCVVRTAALLRDVMEHDYGGAIKRKLDDVYRTAPPTAGTRGAEKTERELRQAFIILLNDLDVSSSHMERLIRDMGGSPALEQHFLESEVAGVREALGAFATLVPRFRSTLRAGIEQLFNQLLRPKLRSFLLDVYKDVVYVLDDDGYAAAEYQDVVRKRFVKQFDTLFEGYKEMFTESNFGLFFGLVVDIIIRPWEKLVMTFRFNELGAIRFDRDLRAITTYLSGQTAFGDVRDKFTRLQQIAILLNLDSEEDVDEFYNGSGVTWKLNADEARAVAALKV